jgi:hypothetical protein
MRSDYEQDGKMQLPLLEKSKNISMAGKFCCLKDAENNMVSDQNKCHYSYLLLEILNVFVQ